MPVKVKKIMLWRKELQNRPGTLAEALEPVAKAGADLQVVMGYCYPGDRSKAAVELFPVSSKKPTAAAQAAGFGPAGVTAVQVEGDNLAGLGHALTKALADAGVNLDFLVAQVIGRKYSAVMGFENEADAAKAIPLIKKASKKKK
jgi:hypothetical protein